MVKLAPIIGAAPMIGASFTRQLLQLGREAR